MQNAKRVLAIIPARGGSKGIKKKNLRQVGGVSLLGHAVRIAQLTPSIDAVVVSSDCEEILSEGEQYGADYCVKRPDFLAQDDTPALPVWQHAWDTYEKVSGEVFDIAAWLQPTSPLRSIEDIEHSIMPVADNQADSTVTLSKLPGHYLPEKILKLDNSGLVSRYINKKTTDLRQDAPDYYFRNGYCYAANKQAIFVEELVLSKKCLGIVLNKETVNIDELCELHYANFLYGTINETV